jgi:hypothetical protein
VYILHIYIYIYFGKAIIITYIYIYIYIALEEIDRMQKGKARTAVSRAH